MQTSGHMTLGSSPGALVFSRDMFLNVQPSSDWHTITHNEKTCQLLPTYNAECPVPKIRLHNKPNGIKKGP